MSDELTKDVMPQAANDFVEQAQQAAGVELDFSPQSLQSVEDILEAFHTSKDKPEGISGILFMCGAYVGEVVRKHHSGQWVNVVELPEETRGKVSDFVTSLPVAFECEGTFLSPYDKVQKRVHNGAEDSITHWANVATKKQFVEVRKFGTPRKGFFGRIFGGN